LHLCHRRAEIAERNRELLLLRERVLKLARRARDVLFALELRLVEPVREVLEPLLVRLDLLRRDHELGGFFRHACS